MCSVHRALEWQTRFVNPKSELVFRSSYECRKFGPWPRDKPNRKDVWLFDAYDVIPTKWDARSETQKTGSTQQQQVAAQQKCLISIQIRWFGTQITFSNDSTNYSNDSKPDFIPISIRMNFILFKSLIKIISSPIHRRPKSKRSAKEYRIAHWFFRTGRR